MNYSTHTVSKTSALVERLSIFILNYLPILAIPILGLTVSHVYGHFLWGDFYRQFLWVISMAFLLQSGSRQLLGQSMQDDLMEDELKQGLQSRIVLLLICCVLLLFLPFSILQTLLLSVFLALRFAGDTLISIHRLTGNNRRAAIAELAFWLMLFAGIFSTNGGISVREILQTVVSAAFIRFLLADPRILRTIFPLAHHAPDSDWLKESFRRFLPQLSSFLFYSADMLIASFLLPLAEFSNYQIAIGVTAAAGILLNLFLAGKRSRSLTQTITLASFSMIPVVLLMRFVLVEYSGILLTPWYLLIAYAMTVSGAISAYFIRWLLEDREVLAVQKTLFILSTLHLVVFPMILMNSNFQDYLFYQGAFHVLAMTIFIVVSYRKGYK